MIDSITILGYCRVRYQYCLIVHSWHYYVYIDP
jgi:hypothetical protein